MFNNRVKIVPCRVVYCTFTKWLPCRKIIAASHAVDKSQTRQHATSSIYTLACGRSENRRPPQTTT